MTLKLRDYQQQALDAEARHRLETPDETRLAIVLPTGTGKAITLAERARRFIEDIWTTPQRVLILVHTDELVSQLEATCRLVCKASEFPIRVGVVKADRDETDAEIIIGSVQTLANPERRNRIWEIGLVIVDECHHAAAPTYQEILKHFGALGCMCGTTYATYEGPERDCPEHGDPASIVPALGFTATLERGDGAGLGSVWQDVAFTRDISWAVRRGYLVQPTGYRLEIDPGVYRVRHSGDVHDVADHLLSTSATVQDGQLMESMAPEKIVEKWMELAKDRKTIAFMPLVRSASALRSAFLAVGVRADLIHGELGDTERRRVVQDFRAGRIQVLCNAMVLTEGFDDPDTSCVIVGRPTKSRSLFIQMAGRGLRPAPGRPVEDQDCILITLADTSTDLCSIADLSDRPLERRLDGPLTEMEDAWDIGKDLEEAARHWTGRVDATQFDPIIAARSKVWAKTKAGHWFLPISKDREYVFLLNEEIYVLTRDAKHARAEKAGEAPDLELAFSLAEDEATERGGDIGALLADRTRAWRTKTPSDKMLARASTLGLDGEVARIMAARTGGKAGKISDLIRRVEASRSIDKMAAAIKERRSV